MDNRKALTGMKVAILAASGFEQVEMEAPRQALREAGADVVLVSPDTDVQGWNHTEKADVFPADVALKEARPTDYDALLLPGGVINPDTLRGMPEAVDFVRAFNKDKKPIAAICHGPQLLINAEIVKGRRLTSFASIKVDLSNAGADWKDEATVCDGNLLTSRKPDDIPQFNKAMIDLFQAHI